MPNWTEIGSDRQRPITKEGKGKWGSGRAKNVWNEVDCDREVENRKQIGAILGEGRRKFQNSDGFPNTEWLQQKT